MEIEENIKEALIKVAGVKSKEIVIEIPKQNLGDYAFPCFQLSSEQKKNPAIIAKEIVEKLSKKLPKEIGKIEASGGYVNFFLNKEIFAKQVLEEIDEKKEKYGMSEEGKGKSVVIDFSSPNIAKPFNIGHLRSTILGFSLYRIFNFLDYKSIGVNHVGDWGTQFGQLIYAYNKWGSETSLKKEPIKHLLELYVRFNQELENKPELQEQAREEFKKLENNDKKAVELWKNFRELSLKDFNKIYELLGVKFDYITGESFYNDKMARTVELLKAKKLTEMSQGALVVNLEKYKMPPCILKKSDEASTYATRDLTAALYRQDTFKPAKILYVVGSEQRLHFKQVFKVLELAGFDFAKNCVHVPFGLIRLHEGKLSTRAGRVVFMEDVLEKGFVLAKKIIEKKNPKLSNKEKVARAVAIGAIIYSDISNDRVLDIKFDWNKALSFEGNSGPYLQYAYVRASSILKKIGKEQGGKINFNKIDDKEFILLKEISRLNNTIKQASLNFKPNIIANYVYNLSQTFNDFYENCPVINAEQGVKARRIALVRATKQVVENCLGLLCIPIVDTM